MNSKEINTMTRSITEQINKVTPMMKRDIHDMLIEMGYNDNDNLLEVPYEDDIMVEYDGGGCPEYNNIYSSVRAIYPVEDGDFEIDLEEETCYQARRMMYFDINTIYDYVLAKYNEEI